MPDETVFIFDSSYPSIDIAVPIDDRVPHVVVSNRRIEPPPGHRCLKLEEETSLASILRNLRLVRSARAEAANIRCIVIAGDRVRPEQLLFNTTYAVYVSRNVRFFDGVSFKSVRQTSFKLLKAAIVSTAKYFFDGLRLRFKLARFNQNVRSLPDYKTEEGRLFGLYAKSDAFSLPFDKVTPQEDGKSVYGDVTRGWHLPEFSSRRLRYCVQTNRHVLRDVTLHMEKIGLYEESSLFKDGRILDYPYFISKIRHRYRYPVLTRRETRTLERGINLLAYVSFYYHWLLEGVPRILDVIDDGFDFDEYPLLLPPLTPFQRELLELFGIVPERQVVTVDVGDWCHVRECIFPTAPFPFSDPEIENPSGQPHRALLTRIRERVMARIAAVKPLPTSMSKKLYISRAKAGRRKFSDETEAAVTSILNSAGFERVFLEDLPWTAQVQLVANSEIIVGLHGAGLANILFSNAKALLEFHNPLEVRPYFAVIARELDIKYAYVIGHLTGQSPNFTDITVDLRTVEKMVQNLELAAV